MIDGHHPSDDDSKDETKDDSKENNNNSIIRSGEQRTGIKLEIKDKNGVLYPSHKVFIAAFQKIKEEINSLLNENYIEVEEHEIQYILTVPAIWNYKAKQLMKEWAMASGLVGSGNEQQLRIVLEPDCASLSVLYQIKGNYISKTFRKGSKYILVDAGGGTCDVACHQLLGNLRDDDFGVKEVLHPSGGIWGGAILIDEEFKKILSNMFSKEWMATFEESHSESFLELMENFRKSKNAFGMQNHDHKIKLPRKFISEMRTFLLRKKGTENVQEYINNFNLLPSAKWFKVPTKKYSMAKFYPEDSTLHLHSSVWRDMFDVVVDPIINHCRNLLKHPLMKDCRHMCLVGGLSCNKYFYDRMYEVFCGEGIMHIIQPAQPMLSVAEGAALLGVTKHYIRARVLSKTYGYILNFPESECKKLGMDPTFIEENRYFDKLKNEQYVSNCFQIIATKNSTIFTNQIIKSSSFRMDPEPDQSVSCYKIYCSDKTNPLMKSDGRELARFKFQYDENDNEIRENIKEFHFHDSMLRVFSYLKDEPENKTEISLEYARKSFAEHDKLHGKKFIAFAGTLRELEKESSSSPYTANYFSEAFFEKLQSMVRLGRKFH